MDLIRIEIVERCLERYSYYNKLSQKLLESIEKNHKEKIDFLAKNLITTFINWGVSKQYLYTEFKEFFIDGPERISSIEQLKYFLSKIQPMQHGFSVYFKVSGNINKLKDSLGFFNIKIPEEIDAEIKTELDKITLSRRFSGTM